MHLAHHAGFSLARHLCFCLSFCLILGSGEVLAADQLLMQNSAEMPAVNPLMRSGATALEVAPVTNWIQTGPAKNAGNAGANAGANVPMPANPGFGGFSSGNNSSRIDGGRILRIPATMPDTG